MPKTSKIPKKQRPIPSHSRTTRTRKGRGLSPPTYGLHTIDEAGIQRKKKREDRKPVQPKLKIGQPGDKYEKEADRVADQVMRKSKAKIQSKRLEEEEKKVRSKPLADQISPLESNSGQREAGTSLESRLNSSKGGGRPLPEPTLSFMEQAFGTDFSGVRIHMDTEAVRMNEELGAKAFTLGQDIYFNKGLYQPEASAGKRLLGHELGHVVQQNSSMPGFRIQREEEKKSTSQVDRQQDLIITYSCDILGEIIVKTPTYEGRSPVIVGKKDFWEAILKSLNKERYEFFLEPFLIAATEHNFPIPVQEEKIFEKKIINTCKRAPNENEIMEFMMALYSVGEEFKEPKAWWNIIEPIYHQSLKTLIRRYQGKVLKEIAAKEGVIDVDKIKPLVEKVPYRIRAQMASRALKNAYSAVVSLSEMYLSKKENKEKMRIELYTIRNAGILIGSVLEKQEEIKASEIPMGELILDLALDLTKFDEIPGVQTLLRRLPTIKKLVRTAFKDSLKTLTKKEGGIPKSREIEKRFAKMVFDLAKNDAFPPIDEQVIINTFVIGVKD